MADYDPTAPFEPGDATPDDIPNPPTPERGALPGDGTLPTREHDTTGFGTVPNFDGVAFAIPTKRHKDTAALDAPLAEPVTDYYDDGQAVSVAKTVETAARRFSAYSLNVPGSAGVYPGDPVRLVGQDTARQRTLLSASAPVLVGSFDQISSGSGFFLPANLIFDTQAQGEIFACAPIGTATPATVGVWVEQNVI